jgi:RimJ/RimL family protein N-acetyltransferase
MIEAITLRGPRLILRAWRLPADFGPLFALNGDPAVMRHFPAVPTRAESDAWAERLAAHGATHGWTFWPVELPGVATLAGVVGLHTVSFTAPFTPPANHPSWRLMERLGMRREADFGHPRVEPGHRLHIHRLYALDRPG